MSALNLTTAQRRELRAQAHHLDPVVMIGAEGLTAPILREADAALRSHGLIKVRVFADDRPAREQMLGRLCEELSAAPVQHIGKLLVIWRPRPETSRAPSTDRKPGPHVVKIVSYPKSGRHRATVKKVEVLGNERLTAGGLVKRRDPRRARPGVSPKKRAGERTTKPGRRPGPSSSRRAQR